MSIFQKRLHWPTLGVVLVTAITWAFVALALASCQTAYAEPAVAWERSYAVKDSMVVPVRWAPSCDALGCADAYRVTWTWGDPIATVPTPTVANGGTTPPRGNAQNVVPPPRVATPVLREVTLTTTRDSLRVPLPAVGQPQTVCVSIVAIRRGLASDARRGCRTIEAPDAPPPPVDSIRWDSLGVKRETGLYGGAIDVTTFEIDFGAVGFRDTIIDGQLRTDSVARHDSIFWAPAAWEGASATDSGLVYIPVIDARYRYPVCFTARDTAEQLVLLVPPDRYAFAQLAAYVDRCRRTPSLVRAVAAGVPVWALRADVRLEVGVTPAMQRALELDAPDDSSWHDRVATRAWLVDTALLRAVEERELARQRDAALRLALRLDPRLRTRVVAQASAP